MTISSPHVRPIEPADEARWRALWAGYLAFYRQQLPDAITDATWRRILDPASGMFCRLVETTAEVQGFTISVLHPGTWVTEPICYLEDLFVAPSARGQGLGQLLLDDLLALARQQRWARVYWHTDAGNTGARRLYDRYTPADDFVRYRLFLD